MLGFRHWQVIGLCVTALAQPAANFAQQIDLGRPPVAPRAALKSAPAPIKRLYEPNQWIDTTNRAEVRSAYLNDFMPTLDVPIEWTGDVAAGNAGETSMAYKQAVIRRVNWFRAMAGVPARITLNLVFSAKAQQAALMMAANQSLSHNPPTDWLHYTADGAEAASKSNICLTFNQDPDPGCVAGYVEDSGSNNTAVGHRRWILHPPTREMGTGDVPQTAGNWAANSLWVFDDHLFDPRPPTRDEFVAWPPPGYVPREVVYDRWSLGFPNADFSGATITMEANGQTVNVLREPLATGFGENTIVWVPDKPSGNGAGDTGDVSYRVTVANVMVSGAPRSFTYEVTAFDPNVAGADGPEFPIEGLISAASVQAGPIASESWLDLYGTNLATGDAWDPALPNSLGGTSVMFTDSTQTERPARLHFVTPLRIQFLAPAGMAEGAGTIQITNPLGSKTAAIQIVRLRPSIFAANTNGKGPAAGIWLRVAADNSRTTGFTASADPVPNSVNVPINLGGAGDRVFVSFFGSGFRSAATVQCTIDAGPVPVTSAGAQGQFPGLDQFDLGPMPGELRGRSDAAVACTFDGTPANSVTLSFQ